MEVGSEEIIFGAKIHPYTITLCLIELTCLSWTLKFVVSSVTF